MHLWTNCKHQRNYLGVNSVVHEAGCSAALFVQLWVRGTQRGARPCCTLTVLWHRPWPLDDNDKDNSQPPEALTLRAFFPVTTVTVTSAEHSTEAESRGLLPLPEPHSSWGSVPGKCRAERALTVGRQIKVDKCFHFGWTGGGHKFLWKPVYLFFKQEV